MVNTKFPLLILIWFLSGFTIFCQELPEEEIQANFNGYFDNFGVNVIYPEISAIKNVTSTTSLNGRILIDAITAASMKSHFDSIYSFINKKYAATKQYGIVDAYSSATKPVSQGGHGGGHSSPNEFRKEFVVGVTQFLGQTSVSLNNIYSTEHDYSSETVTGSFSIPFAEKNTIFTAGIVKSWDKIFPVIRYWTETKDVLTINMSLSQILSKTFLVQGELFYSHLSGFLSDPYEIVTVKGYDNSGILSSYEYYEPIYPHQRSRYAASLRGVYQTSENSSLLIGYRYYTDDWDIKSHTLNALYQVSFNDDKILGFGFRYYTQSQAWFYKPEYSLADINAGNYLAVDDKLKNSNSYEFQLKFTSNGAKLPLIHNDKIEMISQISFYLRNTDTPDWHSRYYTLTAYLISLGFRFLL